MANYNNLKDAIKQVIKQNGNQEITGNVLQNTLLSMINSLGDGYQFMGVATPSTNPGTPDQKVFYIASEAGTYSNFGGIEVKDEVILLIWNGSWTKKATGIASQSQLMSKGVTKVKGIYAGITAAKKAGIEDGESYIRKQPDYCEIGIFRADTQTADYYPLKQGDGLFLIDGVYYIYQGDGVIEKASFQKDSQFNDALIYEQGLITASGVFEDSKNDIRIISKLYGSYHYTAPEGLGVRRVIYYYKNNDSCNISSVSDVNLKSEIDVQEVEGCYSRILLSYINDRNKEIDYRDYITNSSVSELSNSIKVLNASSVIYENGTLNVVGISDTDTGKIRTVTRFYGTYRFRAPEKLSIFRILYYNKDTDEFDSLITNQQSYPTELIIQEKENCYTRLVLADENNLDKEIDYRDYINNTSLSYMSENFNVFKKKINPVIIAYENGGLNISGEEVEMATRIRTATKIYGSYHFEAPKGLRLLLLNYYKIISNEYYSSEDLSGTEYDIPEIDGCYARVSMCDAVDKNKDIDYRDYVSPSSLSQLNDSLDDVSTLPIYDFNLGSLEFLDIGDALQGMDFEKQNADNSYYTFQEQIYAKFDELVTKYPDYISKVDAAELVDLSYPDYANLNGAAQGNYLATPTYKTYMYKLINPDIIQGSAGEGKVLNIGELKRKKLFIMAGIHGWELASQFNTYILAKHLCECVDYNYYAMRLSTDIYIVPCVNGYGAYHKTRPNGNKVDINRNFPTPHWKISGEGTDWYSGASAGSEFETQLVMKLAKLLMPDMTIDHHSYGGTTYNFYVDTLYGNPLKISYQNLIKFAYKCNKEFPENYGTQPFLKPNIQISYYDDITDGSTCNVWMHKQGIKFSPTIEVCHSIAFKNGVFSESTSKETYMGSNIVRLNELMLRLFIMKYTTML